MSAPAFELDLLSRTPVGQLAELPSVGTPLEPPRIFDSAAQVLKTLAQAGLVEVVHERHDLHNGLDLITALSFRRLR
jgi:hypothetical protein